MDEKALAAVQKLEWRKVQDGEGGFIGDKKYRYVRYGWGGSEYGGEIFLTIEAARAAAQRDFAVLVLEMAALANLSPGSTGETEGWVLVPKEPTREMINAGFDALERSLPTYKETGRDCHPYDLDCRDWDTCSRNDDLGQVVYRAMLSAAGER